MIFIIIIPIPVNFPINTENNCFCKALSFQFPLLKIMINTLYCKVSILILYVWLYCNIFLVAGILRVSVLFPLSKGLKKYLRISVSKVVTTKLSTSTQQLSSCIKQEHTVIEEKKLFYSKITTISYLWNVYACWAMHIFLNLRSRLEKTTNFLFKLMIVFAFICETVRNPVVQR